MDGKNILYNGAHGAYGRSTNLASVFVYGGVYGRPDPLSPLSYLSLFPRRIQAKLGGFLMPIRAPAMSTLILDRQVRLHSYNVSIFLPSM